MSRAASIAMGLVLAMLLAIGVATAVMRGISVAGDDPSAHDRDALQAVAAIARLAPGSQEYARLAREIPKSAANINERPRATLLHVAAGALFFLLVPLQFSRRLRARHPAVHRWNGRAMLAIVLVSTSAGLYLGLARPYGGMSESAATTLFGGFLVFCAARGYRSIRARDARCHREWMIRTFALALAISVIRVIGFAGAALFGAANISPDGFALTLWVGWIVTLVAAELWILRTRPRGVAESAAVLQPL